MENSIVQEVFSPLYGHPCWNAKSGYGSFITMEFGKPSLIVREPRPANPAVPPAAKNLARRTVSVRGQWHLWIHPCEWQVFTKKRCVGHSNLAGSSKRPIERAAREIDGQKLVRVSVSPQGNVSLFEFDLGSRLAARPYNQTSDQWLLYEPSGNVFVLRGDGLYSHQPGNTRPDEEVWMSLELIQP